MFDIGINRQRLRRQFKDLLFAEWLRDLHHNGLKMNSSRGRKLTVQRPPTRGKKFGDEVIWPLPHFWKNCKYYANILILQKTITLNSVPFKSWLLLCLFSF